MRRFFAEDRIGTTLLFDADESKHLNRVLRMQVGEEIEVADGSGKLFHAQISVSNAKASKAEIVATLEETQEKFGIHIAAAPTKNLSRWEMFLEKATEIGIDRISPMLCDNSERKVLKRDRQERILKSAVKQSHKLLIPDLDEMIPFKALLSKFEGLSHKYIAHCEAKLPKTPLKKLHQVNSEALILIGPEGDFSPQEIQMAEQAGFQSVSLGESRLRTETAALVALHTIHLIND